MGVVDAVGDVDEGGAQRREKRGRAGGGGFGGAEDGAGYQTFKYGERDERAEAGEELTAVEDGERGGCGGGAGGGGRAWLQGARLKATGPETAGARGESGRWY